MKSENVRSVLMLLAVVVLIATSGCKTDKVNADA